MFQNVYYNIKSPCSSSSTSCQAGSNHLKTRQWLQWAWCVYVTRLRRPTPWNNLVGCFVIKQETLAKHCEGKTDVTAVVNQHTWGLWGKKWCRASQARCLRRSWEIFWYKYHMQNFICKGYAVCHSLVVIAVNVTVSLLQVKSRTG